MATHTPGPWKLREDGEANSWAVLGPNDNWLLSFLHNGEQLSEKQRANARLIAAAPDLLAAAKRIVARIDGLRGLHPEWSDMIDTIFHEEDGHRDAIRKAEGRS